MTRIKVIKSKKQVSIELQLLRDLDDIQRRTAIKNCDLAIVLSVTPSYLTVTRSRMQVSDFMFPKIKHLISTLDLYQKRSDEPLFIKYHGESDEQFRARRAKLIASFKSAYELILDNLENKKDKNPRKK